MTCPAYHQRTKYYNSAKDLGHRATVSAHNFMIKATTPSIPTNTVTSPTISQGKAEWAEDFLVFWGALLQDEGHVQGDSSPLALNSWYPATKCQPETYQTSAKLAKPSYQIPFWDIQSLKLVIPRYSVDQISAYQYIACQVSKSHIICVYYNIMWVYILNVFKY